MPTVINNPGSEPRSSGMGLLLGFILVLLMLFLFFYYGLPALRGGVGNTGPSVTIPDQIDVNVNQGSGNPPPAQ